MLTSITPFGERASGRDHRWTVALYTAASILGGLTTGVVLGLVGRLPIAHRSALAAGICLLAGMLDLLHRVPSRHRQVDEDWLTRYRRWVWATGFGWQLGTGVTTIVTSAATYAWLGLVLLQESLPAALLVGGAFGTVRALPVVLARFDSPDRLRTAAAGWDRRALPAARLTMGALLVGSVALVTV